MTAHQLKFVIATASATALALDTDKAVQQTMEVLLMLVVLLAFAVRFTMAFSVDALTTVTAHTIKYARRLQMHVSLKSIGYRLIVICVTTIKMLRVLLQTCR